jgi:hypothetical protein
MNQHSSCRLLESPPECKDSLLATPGLSSGKSGGSAAHSNSEAADRSAALAAESSSCCPVERASSLSYYQFVERYMAPNLPVLIKVKTADITCDAYQQCCAATGS